MQSVSREVALYLQDIATCAAKEQHPMIDWRRMSGLRDILAHAYFGMDDLILWDLVQHKIPALVVAMAGLTQDPS